MNNFIKIKILLALILLSINQNFKAQCSGCTTTVTPGVSSYTAASGQTLCVAGGVNYTGTLVLNGGTICNSGTINNITFLSGTFLNYGTYSGGNVSINLTGNVTAENYNGSRFDMGSLTFSATAATRILALNIYKGASSTFTSSILKNAGVINIEVGRSNPGGNPIATSTLNVNSLFTVKKDNFSLLIQSEATVNLIDILSLESTGVKTVTNYGMLNMSRDLNMISAGSAASTVTINNNNIITLRSLSASYTAGKVFINNNAASTMTVTSSLTLSKSTNTLTNAGNLLVTSNFNIQAGFATNSGTMTQSSLSATGGTVTNNNLIKSSADFLVTNTAARINNNKSILVANTFSNISTINTSTQSIISTSNYYNSGTTATINGVSSGTDTLLFPRIFISNISNNSGFINNKIFIYDASLTSTTSNIGYGFDAVTSTTRIASTVVWGSKAVAPGNGNPGIVNCRQLASMLGVQISPSPSGVICAGTPLNLTGNFGYYYYTFDPNNNPILVVAPITIAPSSFFWIPGSVTGNPVTFTPLVSTIYTVTITYNTCVYTATYAVTVSANTAIISGAPLINFVMTDPIALNGSVIGGTAPYSYVWTPNNFFVNPYLNTQQNTQVSPPLSLTYTLTITDFYGCVASTTITVIAKPYAFLNKIPDGGYYKVFNNKLLFEFDGQYAQTGLVYKVFDKTNAVIASNAIGNIANNLVVNSGDNRYYLNVSSAGIPNGYYVLEVTNEKNEKLYLKFQK
jgi:hypothetical protein